MPSSVRKRKRWDQQLKSCCWCGHFLQLEMATWEHIIPDSLGGTNEIDNLALAHLECNRKRGNNTYQQPCQRIEFDFIRIRLQSWNRRVGLATKQKKKQGVNIKPKFVPLTQELIDERTKKEIAASKHCIASVEQMMEQITGKPYRYEE